MKRRGPIIWRWAFISSLALAVVMAASTATSLLIDKARALEGRGRMDLAALAWQQVLMADPNQQDALVSLARYAKQSGKADEAKTYLNRLRRVNPNNPAIAEIEKMQLIGAQRPRLDEAGRLAASQQYEQAMKIYREVFGDEPPAGGWAIAYYQTEAATPGGWDHATAGLQELSRKYPDNQEYRLALGQLYTYHPQTRAKGVELLESIPASSVLAGKARQAWRQALLWEGAHPASSASYRSFLSRYPDPELQKMLTEMKAPPPAESAETKADLLRGREEKLGYTALNSNRLADAQAHFEKALQEAPKSVGALSGLGFVAMKNEDFDAAVDFFERAKSAAPANKQLPEALNTARFWKSMKGATAAQKENRLDAAIELFRQAVAMRAANIDAVTGLAGSYMQQGMAAPAIPLYEKIVHLQPQNADAWRGLVTAKYKAGNDADALAAAKQMPDAARATLEKDPEYLALIAFIHAEVGEQRESSRYLQQAVDVARAQKTELPFNVQLQFAGLFLRSGKPAQAVLAFERVADAHPTNVDAWQGLLSALIQTPKYEVHALSALRRMPKETYSSALRRPAFLRDLATLYVTLKRLDLAEAFLEKSLEIESEGGHEVSAATQLQLAGLWRTSKPAKAEALLRRLADKHAESPDVWKAWISMLHTAGRDPEALAETQRIPPDVLKALETDPSYVTLQATILSRNGRSDEALEAVRTEAARLEMDKQPVPVGLQTELAWLLLEREDSAQELYSILEQAAARRDLTAAQQQDFGQIWSIWIRRRAQSDIAGGDLDKGIAILRAGARLLPNDNSIRGNLAGNLLKAGQNRAAFEVYRAWGLAGGDAADYLGAVGAAMSARDSVLANQWLAKGLQHFPRDPKLLTLAGKQAAMKGDYKKAEAYLRAARAVLPREDGRSAVDRLKGLGDSGDEPLTRSLGQLLLDEEPPAGNLALPVSPFTAAPEPRTSSPVDLLRPTDAPVPLRNEANPDPNPVITKAAWQTPSSRPTPRAATPATDPLAPDSSDADFFRSLLQAVEPQSPQTLGATPAPPPAPVPAPSSSPGILSRRPAQQSFLPSALAPAEEIQPKTEREEIDDQIAAIQDRNSPYFGGTSAIQGRSGQAGYDKLITEEDDLEVSTAINNQVRLTLVARPTFLDAGTADGTSTLRFGLLPAGVAPPAQSANGLAADVQLSTPAFGLRVGSSPREFLVHNWIGGLRYRPGNGPITFLFTRDDVKDTMLSYSGSRDPVTNQVWGGVVANAYQVIGNWGDGNSGFYTNFSYQSITGQNVASNWRIDGTAGTYWKLYTRSQGSLTVGLNFSAMHYDKNLRFFTYGQGGYFSPQEYYLFNIPIHWNGTWKRQIQYSISGSLGYQHFVEDESPYFPSLPLLQGPSGSFYSGQTSTGANYNLDVKVAYQLSPNWLVGVYANANNARDYNMEAFGVYVKYLLQPRPILQDLALPSIPDWKGVQPFALP